MILSERKNKAKESTCCTEEKIQGLKKVLSEAEGIVIGAGAGLSASAGFSYGGARFLEYFQDFSEKYNFKDMYTGGFYQFDTLEEHWAYWSRLIYVNRYMNPPKPVYEDLLKLVRGKDYFILTTNVDHCFQKTGFDKRRLFYTQGDYGLLQCSSPCHKETYDNEEIVRQMVEAQGFEIAPDGTLTPPEKNGARMCIPSELVPLCPKCGRPLAMNLRADDTFVEDEGWSRAARQYSDFLYRHRGMKLLFLELGVGYNTPVIIKYPFWKMTYENPNAIYASINYRDAAVPKEIQKRSVCIEEDIGEMLAQLIREGERA